MGNSAIGRGTAIEENKVKASSGDGTPGFLDGKVDDSTIAVVGNQIIVKDKGITTAKRADGTDGEIPTWDAAGVAANVAVGTVGQVLTSGGVGVAPTFQAAGGATQMAQASFTRDISLASGTQGITGVGFIPAFVYIVGVIGATDTASWGVEGPVGTQSCLLRRNSGTYDSSGTHSILFFPSVGSYFGDITSFDADGFTITWTKTGSPTGTAALFYLAWKV